MIEIIDSKDTQSLARVFNRSQIDDNKLAESVRAIVDDVASGGDAKLFEYIKRFDGLEVDKNSLIVSEEEIDKAYDEISPELLESLRRAKANILEYHNRQRERFDTTMYNRGNSTLGWIYRPLNKVGLYVPGGKASYPSSILMCALPAVSAGVSDISITTPNINNPLILVAARECGVKRIYKMGGAHAVAALAYGTESVEKVDMIAGPGNVYVTLAKKAVYGKVAIDMIAGPSEILIIADKSANARFLAADMLSQAEHDEMSASILITTDKTLAKEVQIELDEQLKALPKAKIASKAIETNGAIIVVDSIEEGVEISDKIAPEHLELCIANADKIATRINNAGAIFIGNYSPEPLGDYFAGASHCLPTSGSARYFSVLNVDTFMKKISYIEYDKCDLLSSADDIIAIAESEGLTAHANSIRVRKTQN